VPGADISDAQELECLITPGMPVLADHRDAGSERGSEDQHENDDGQPSVGATVDAHPPSIVHALTPRRVDVELPEWTNEPRRGIFAYSRRRKERVGCEIAGVT
jgi:hypothetical protein